MVFQTLVGKVHLSVSRIGLMVSKYQVVWKNKVWPQRNFDSVFPQVNEFERALDSTVRVFGIEGNHDASQWQRGVVIGEPFGHFDCVFEVDETGANTAHTVAVAFAVVLVVEKLDLQISVIDLNGGFKTKVGGVPIHSCGRVVIGNVGWFRFCCWIFISLDKYGGGVPSDSGRPRRRWFLFC